MSLVLICDSDWHDEPYILDFETGYEEVSEGEHLCDYCLERRNRPPREPSQFDRVLSEIWGQHITRSLVSATTFKEVATGVRSGDTIVFTKHQTIT